MIKCAYLSSCGFSAYPRCVYQGPFSLPVQSHAGNTSWKYCFLMTIHFVKELILDTFLNSLISISWQPESKTKECAKFKLKFKSSVK